MENNKSVPIRVIWMFVVPLAAILLIGYVYVRSQNRAMQMKTAQAEEKMGILEGEVYRFKQSIAQKEAKLEYLINPSLIRFLGYENDSSFVWLFYRPSDEAWLVEVSHVLPVDEGLTYHLLVDEYYVGNFERISDTVGLQKIGVYPKGNSARVFVAPREDFAPLSDEKLLYTIDLRNSESMISP